jgi:hypothetical protein
MRKWTVFIIVMLIGGLLTAGTVQPDPADAYQTAVHPLIASYARILYSNPEITAHAASIDAGAYHEDELDHVWDRSMACTTINHFWDADLGPDDEVWSVFCDGPNAWQKSRILWGMALGEYHAGHVGTAYEYLGHVAHLLMDMAVPAHAHEDMHPWSDEYEDWLGVPEAALTTAELDGLIALGPVELPGGAINPLYRLFYLTNQRADFYASEDYDGDSIDPNGWVDFSGLEDVAKCRDQDDFDNECLSIVRRNLHPYAIRAVATLYQLFEEATRQDTALTVVIDRVQELECHDDLGALCESGPDYFVRIYIDGFWFRNEGNQIEDTADISPGWAFARGTGLSGSVPVVVQLWDEDEEPNADDKSDIDPADGPRDLDLVVDLGKCIALEPGAISGDVIGACGASLSIAGDESDRSRIWFHIIPPNAPPTADAGPDQAVDEADLVTLNGSFADPNVEDTHTFLWHLESSTNGQAVPDTTTQSLSFTALDNGAYTFTFTVTDNHGAQDSDTVVVTAANVAPVAAIDRITDETGAEIGVDVPVVLVGLGIDLEGSFTDVGTLDTHTAILNWGDGTSQTETEFASFSDCLGGVTGTLQTNHIYTDDGSYTITLDITDKDGDVGTTTSQIEVVDAADAVAAVAEALLPLADDPDIQTAIGKLVGEQGGVAASGAFDLLEKGNLNAALEKIKQALAYLEAAEAADPDLDLTFEKGLLTLAAKSAAVGAIGDAEVHADQPNEQKRVQEAKDLVALGDGLLAASDNIGAVGNYQEAAREVQGVH